MMNRQFFFLVVALVSSWLASANVLAQSNIDFNRDVRPILSDKCFHCHGPDEETRAADLRFDDQNSAFADLGGYFAIVPGKPEQSELVTRIHETDEDLKMPPPDSGKELTSNEIATLTQWIKEGAGWNKFWAYVPPRRSPIPEPTEISEPRFRNHWIDRMVFRRLEQEKIRPVAKANSTTLIRRLYFDLIGLPPTPAEAKAFIANPSQENYERIVDELLASPHFGERLAIYWLDLVRFADTVGYHGDQDHNISPYRDYVINAFNSNKPFDKFTIEQLAGDLLPEAGQQQLIASGYNRLLQTTHEGGLQPKEYTAIYAADRVRNVSAVWMGATVGCAQCHDHKYDPYTAKDFYALSAFFADVDDEAHFKNGTNALPTRRSPEILILQPDDQKRLEQLKKELQREEDRLKLMDNIEKQKEKSGKIATANLELDLETRKELEARIGKLKRELKQVESRGAWTMISRPLRTPRITRVLPRGNWLDESGEIVTPQIPEFMGTLENEQRNTRLDLANWLVDEKRDSGKLTARVFANRVWFLLMGAGISESLDDFGGQGQPPVHPELLDNLALSFVDGGWDLKRLIREIVVSQTYQLSSNASQDLIKKDPYNQLFARQSRFRLPAELIRDNALAISGLLNLDQVGGKSVKPYQPAGYYRHLNFPPRRYKATTNAEQYRRGVYVHWQRQFLHPTLRALDAPNREECTTKRSKSNTPLAALALLNDATFVEAARAFAARLLVETNQIDSTSTLQKRTGKPEDSFDAVLDRAFWRAVSRSPSKTEKQILRQLFSESKSEFEANPQATDAFLSIGMAPVPNRIEKAELAAWTAVARAVLNLDETISRN